MDYPYPITSDKGGHIMETITLEQVYYIGEIFGLAAVIGSLIFVGLQVRQNAQAVRVNMAHGISTEWLTMQLDTASDTELAGIVFKANQNLEDVSGDEKMRYYLWMNCFFLALSDAYYQYRQGTFSADAWFGFKAHFTNLANMPGIRAYWNERKEFYPESFRNYFEEEMLAKPATAGWKMAGT